MPSKGLAGRNPDGQGLSGLIGELAHPRGH
jgi:hypothetical protein